MQRYNIYKHVNKGIRALLFETALKLQQCDFCEKAQRNEAIAKVKEALLVVERCNLLQRVYIFSLTKQYEPSLTMSLEIEQEGIVQLITELRAQCHALESAFSTADAIEKAKVLFKGFTRFVTANLEHLPKKEESLNPILCTQFTDREIFKLKRLIVGRMAPQEILSLGKWIIRGLNNAELIDWLQEMQKYVSNEIFCALWSIAEQELSPDRFSAVIDELSEGSLA